MDLEEFKKKWIEVFAAGVPERHIKNRLLSTDKLENYIWHLFSYGFIPEDTFLSGDEARKAFDKVDKAGASYIVPFERRAHVKDITPGSSSSADAEKYTEIYFVGKNYQWTYIKTHETEQCGPYFCYKKSLKR